MTLRAPLVFAASILSFSLVSVVAVAAPVVPTPADGRIATIQVRVHPDRPGWTYALGEPAAFLINVTADDETLVGVEVHYQVGPEKMHANEETVAMTEGGIKIAGGTMQEPGFLRCDVSVDFDGKTYVGHGTAGFAPEMIQPTQKNPNDFDAFWDAQKKQLGKLPLEAQMTLQPDLCTPAVDVYHVSFQNTGVTPASGSSRIYGMLSIPKGPGPFPAVLRVPGAGVRPYAGEVDLAAKGVITLQIGIHGIPVNLPPSVYHDLGRGALSGYQLKDLEDRESCYYRRVYLGCIRANDFLCSLPQFDGKNLAVIGGSQGGQLSIVTAALDPRVRTLVCFYPAYCDVTGYLHGRAGGWPHMMRPMHDGTQSRHATPDQIATTAYYDTVNFARRLTVPGFYSWGFNDSTCPPTSTFAAYNVITAPRQLWLALEAGHASIPEQNEKAEAWLLAQLGVR